MPRGIQTYSLEELGSSKPLLAARVVQFLADYPELQANVVGGYVNFFYQKKLRELEEQEQQIVLDYPAEHFEEIKELALRVRCVCCVLLLFSLCAGSLILV